LILPVCQVFANVLEENSSKICEVPSFGMCRIDLIHMLFQSLKYSSPGCFIKAQQKG